MFGAKNAKNYVVENYDFGMNFTAEITSSVCSFSPSKNGWVYQKKKKKETKVVIREHSN